MMFRKVVISARFSAWVMAGGLLASCAGLPSMDSQKVTYTPPASIGELQNLPANARPRVAVLEFRNKANITSADKIGTGMSDQLVTALVNSNAFTVNERANLDAIDAEQILNSKSDRFNPATATQTAQLEGVDFFIVGAITEFEGSAANAGFGAGGYGYGSGWMSLAAGAASGLMNQSHVAIDVKVIDSRTARVVHACSVEGSPREFQGMISAGAHGILGSLTGGVKEPMEKAVRACIIKAVGEIAEGVKKSGWITNQGQLGGVAPPPAAAAPPAAEAHELTIVDEPSYIRKSASAEGSKIKTLHPGDKVLLLEDDGEWVRVKCGDGTIGWTKSSNFE